MKRFAWLGILIPSVSFAGMVRYNEPKYLDLAHNDPVAAKELDRYCSGSLSEAACIAGLSGAGNLKQEAARKCLRLQDQKVYQFKINSGMNTEAPGARLDREGGSVWTKRYHSDNTSNGRSHRHDWSEGAKKTGELFAIRDYVVAYRQTMDSINGDSVTTHSVTDSKGMDFGASITKELAAFVIETIVNTRWDIATSVSLAQKTGIPISVINEAWAQGQAGRENPGNFGVNPDILYFEDEPYGLGPGEPMNTEYNPNAKKKEESNKDDKKSTENPPKHVDTSIKELPEIEHHEVGKWAGNDELKGPDEPMIATPFSKDGSELSPMEKCVTTEYTLLLKQIGSSTIDSNGAKNEAKEAAVADSLLKVGYCDEQILGHEFCLAKKFKEDSVVAVDIQADRKEAAGVGSRLFQINRKL